MNHHTRDLLTLGIGKVLQVLIGLVTLRLITEMLSEEQVGIYYLLLTVVSLLAFGFFNPLGQFYGRHLIHWQQTHNLKTATNVMLMFRGLAIPFALMLAILLFYVFDYQKYFTASEYIAFILIALIALIHGVLLNATNVLISRVAFTIYVVLTLAIGLGVSVLFMQISQTAMAWIYGLALTQIMFSFILYRLIVKGQAFSITKLKSALKPNYIKSVFFFILPVTITLFLQWGQTASFRLVVEDLYTVQILAFIAVGMAISGAIFSALESLATQFYMPLYLKKITNATKQERTQAWNELADIMLPIYIAVTIYVIVFAPYLAKLLVAEKFFEAYIYAMIGAIIELLRVTTNLIYMVSQSEVKTKNTITPYLFGFLIMIVGLYSIDVSDALWKVPVILAVSYLVTLSIMTFNMKKLLEIQINLWFSIKTILLMSPIFIVYFASIDPTIINAIIFLILGGGYLLGVQYFLLKSKIQKMSAI
ncbi:MAG: hypothetical protein COW76_01135 [Shewanella sp. CG18_big_fil_WC_8_21_14_2_50_42_11]|uniref:lipopolysaccharide biosynthesis protein n=1 Tax=Shewanella TaxID=22 RepID=UPI000C44990D|nr:MULTISPECIES: hypothetical protein [Shewanella]NCP72634.1 hypothetical protein [Shewanella vesiculosa]PIQ02250.1 MAG: hypothetical protein COW76_01135 [Shewanella sp. CG18_big_fil_WC_8_21_14_2_50_42_11]